MVVISILGPFLNQLSLCKLFLVWMQPVNLSQLCQDSIVYCHLSSPALCCRLTYVWLLIILVQSTINSSVSVFPRVKSFVLFLMGGLRGVGELLVDNERLKSRKFLRV